MISAQVFRLTRAVDTSGGYFDVAPGESADAGAARRVASALQVAFRENPYQVVGLEESYASGPIPGLIEAWADGGWRGVAGAYERRLMVPASRGYTIAVIVGLTVATLASLALLWGSVPRRPAPDH